MERQNFAVINKHNHLPVLAFSMTLPNLEEPPQKRGLRLIVERVIEQFRINPHSVPFASEEEIREKVPEMYTVRELPFGIVETP